MAIRKIIKRNKRSLIVTTAFLFLIITSFSFKRIFTGQSVVGGKEISIVKNVIDGDTIELSDGSLVRYIGIDTPESWRKVDGKWVFDPERFAIDAAEFNAGLVKGKKVRLEYDVEKKDKYGRTLAHVFVDDLFVNGEMIKQGYARIYTFPPNVKYTDLLVSLQKEARENKRGFWGEMGDEIVPADEAKKHIGSVKTVSGVILSTYESKKVVFLNFGSNYKTDFTAAIFRRNLKLFKSAGIDPVNYYEGKMVHVTGKIKEYNGPEIIVNHPSEIEVVGE